MTPGHYTHPRNAGCLCGSGKKFKRCCYEIYSNPRPTDAAFTAFSEENHEKALKLCRAHITQYTIWHKSHTEPFVSSGNEGVRKFLEIDIKALSELVNLLFYCYERTNQARQFPDVLERLRTNINNSRWHNRIEYMRTLCALGRNWNREAGRQELNLLGPIKELDDPQILQLYIDLFGQELSFSLMQDLADRIIELSENPVDELHYRGLKAVEYLLIGDEEEADRQLELGIGNFRNKSKKPLNAYENDQLGMNLDLLATLRKDSQLFEEARNLFSTVLEDNEDLTSHGRARFYQSIASTWESQGKWKNALENYLQALKTKEMNIVRVFIARCYLELGDLYQAQEYIDSVSIDNLTNSEQADHAFVYATVAIAVAQENRLKKGDELLRDLQLKSPYFRERRDELRLTLATTKTKSNNANLLEKAKTILSGITKSANRYLLLQPNFMGIGVNVNKVIEDLSHADQEHRKQDSDPSIEEKTP